MTLFRIRIFLTSCLAAFSFIAAKAQTAQEIVAKHIEALGGKERLQSINSVFIEGVAVMGNGTSIDTKLWRVYDRLYRQEISYEAGSVGKGSDVTIVTPNRGWVTVPKSNGDFKSLPANQLRALQPQIDPAGPLADYAAKGCRVDLAGRDTINERPCYRIRLSCPMGQSVVYSIDISTYYILRESRRAPVVAVVNNNEGPQADAYSVDYSDYKKTPDGYIFPFTIINSAFGAKMNVEKVEVNHSVNVDGLSRPGKRPVKFDSGMAVGG